MKTVITFILCLSILAPSPFPLKKEVTYCKYDEKVGYIITEECVIPSTTLEYKPLDD